AALRLRQAGMWTPGYAPVRVASRCSGLAREGHDVRATLLRARAADGHAQPQHAVLRASTGMVHAIRKPISCMEGHWERDGQGVWRGLALPAILEQIRELVAACRHVRRSRL